MVGIGFFAPLPLALMMPFMAGQSLLMGESFGKGFQYGKRKISSMSNEEFNKMTAADLGQQIATDYDAIIPSLEQAVRASTAFQRMIFTEMGEVLKLIPGEILKFFGLEGIEPGTDSDKLSFNIIQVRSWTDSELRAAFENKQNFALYNGITQIYIVDEYNKRFILTEPLPHVHDPSHHPPPPPPPPPPSPITPKITREWLNINATARLHRMLTGATEVWRLWTRTPTTPWIELKRGTKSALIKSANAAYPDHLFAIFIIPDNTGNNPPANFHYYVQKQKL